MLNRVVYFEIPSDDPEKSMDFFKEVFGWKFEQFGNNEYWSAISGDENITGINGAISKRKDPKEPVVTTIAVENLDDYIRKIEKAGGKIVMPKMSVPKIGWIAYFIDPDGNMHGMWQEDRDVK